MKLNVCSSCLKEGFETYCPKCSKKLFNGKKISHILNFTRPDFNKAKIDSKGRLSISGIQIKNSLRIEKDELILTEKNGEYILKPIPSGQFQHLDAVPANEQLTMQIASQVYNLKSAESCIIFFANNEIAYLTKRFDVMRNGEKLLQEDFAQIAKRTEETHGKNYKYDFSYEEIGELIKKFVSAYRIEIEKFYKAVLFNYLFSNGDSHLKNFSLSRNQQYGDYLLTPFYDLLNTSLNVPGESDTALDLFKDGFETEEYKAGSKYTKPDFVEFAKKLEIKEIRYNKILNEIISKTDEVKELVSRSFLTDELKELYLKSYFDKLARISF
ncbi:MAG: HipA domain-containing protein [Melioribacteraceae bacterium]|nr:HipA domain-containing protein [Melioribacteraceae bacterium]MCF8353977.1 HipA domain-containing protein [Melioribacteraceae bacterium]MCF8393705.1 HipA domain-containing protein [Melioribacteraceae bacterium]MCF8419553.1 HipA domain-containing protein [Melioribacteraceae bacterium]